MTILILITGNVRTADFDEVDPRPKSLSTSASSASHDDHHISCLWRHFLSRTDVVTAVPEYTVATGGRDRNGVTKVTLRATGEFLVKLSNNSWVATLFKTILFLCVCVFESVSKEATQHSTWHNLTPYATGRQESRLFSAFAFRKRCLHPGSPMCNRQPHLLTWKGA